MAIKDKIKLVIWDLDDTLWKGTLAECEDITLYKNRAEIVKKLTKRGIVNSICSKNNYDKVKEKLIEFNMWEYFVFAEINFEPKGKKVQQIIQDMQLRPENTLFIDDNISNLLEVEYYNKNINTINALDCDDLLDNNYLKGKKDIFEVKLKQYKQLEKKVMSKRSYTSNDEFLKDSEIEIQFIDYNEDLLDRVEELIQKTNQLNFTKNRMEISEVKALLEQDDVESGCIRVKDKFGDNGIVGFYAKRKDTLIHFIFSCRIMNLGIEQWVYAHLGYPKIDIIGDVASTICQVKCDSSSINAS